MIKVYRLTKVAEVVHFWDFFKRGLEQSARYLRYDLPFDTYRQIMFNLVVNTKHSWVGVVMAAGDPVGFALAHECTPLFSPRREFEVSLLYHQPGNEAATSALQEHFEVFLHDNDVTTYYATTRRDSGAAIRCFQSPRYGFKRAYTVFKKTLT